MKMLKHVRTLVAGGLAIGLGAAAGCGGSPRSSIVTGEVDVQSFPSSDVRLLAASDRGNSVDIPIAADGTFRAQLDRGETWGLFIASDQQMLPVVLRQRDAQLEGTVWVETGGALANLGTLRFWPGASPPEPRVVSSTRALPSGELKPALPPTVVSPPASLGMAPMACEAVEDSKGGCHGDRDLDDDHQDKDGIHQAESPALLDTLDATKALVTARFDLPDALFCAEFADDDGDSDSDSDSDDDAEGDDD